MLNIISVTSIPPIARTANTGLAKVAVQCSADTFVVNQSLVLRINISGENRHLRQALPVSGQAMTTNQHNDKDEKNYYHWTGINDNNNIDYGTI
jgi:hypothetical protein